MPASQTAQVRDHHAIIPTGKPCKLALQSDEYKLYDLVVRRLLSAWQLDYVWAALCLVGAVYFIFRS